MEEKNIKERKKIQVGFLVSYDYNLLKNAIPAVYKDADTIFLAIDKERLTWSGNPFEIKEDFFTWIKSFDKEHKIKFYEDTFYMKGFSSMKCETRERNLLSQKMGLGNWIIQLDSDEYFINFKDFVSFLKKKNYLLDKAHQKQVEIRVFHINTFKKLDKGFLVVKDATRIPIATNYPQYKFARKNKGRVIYHNSLLLHESVSRNKKDLLFKLKNWGHNKDFNIDDYLEKWDNINELNYKSFKNVFHLNPKAWKELIYLPANNLKNLIHELNQNKAFLNQFKKSSLFIFKKNLGQYIKSIFKNKTS